MKQLSKEQLKELVYNKAIKVAEENVDILTERLTTCVKDTDNLATVIVNILAVYKAEIVKECSQTLTETLHTIFYEGKEE